MKKSIVILLICTLCLSIFCFVPSVAAEGEKYYYIKADTTMIIENPDKGITGTINLPATWYVKSTGGAADSNSMILVEYNGIKGKVNTSKLSNKTTELSTTPYFNSVIESIEKKFPICPDSSCNSYIDTPLAIGSKITVLATTAEGHYAISYLQGNETKYAFLDKDISNINITPTENINKKDPDKIGGGDTLTPPGDNNGKTVPTNNVLRIILIVGICILAVLLVFLIFKPTGKKAKNDDFYEDYRP